jgi:hypothetical protein
MNISKAEIVGDGYVMANAIGYRGEFRGEHEDH